MPRLHVVEPDQATGEAKELLEGPLKDMQLNIFKGMANSPAALKAYMAFSGELAKGMLNETEREAILLAIGEANDCGYCKAAHTMLGKQAGLSDEQAAGARRGELPDDPKLDALVKFALRIHEKKGFVTEADINTFREAGYTDGHAAEVVANYALSTFTNYFNHMNETILDLPAAPEVT